MTRPVRPSPPRAGDPYGLGIVGSFLAPVLAIVGLLLVAIITITLLNGELPLGLGRGTATNGGTNGDDPARTPAPSNVVVVPEPSTPTDEPLFLGTMTYAKAGNIWVQTDEGATQLTDSSDGYDSMPSWSPDGKYIYYIQTKRSRGFWPVNGRPGSAPPTPPAPSRWCGMTGKTRPQPSSCSSARPGPGWPCATPTSCA